MLLMAMSVGVMGTGFAATYTHSAKAAGGDLSVSDWNNIGYTLDNMSANGSDSWGFGLETTGTATIETVGGIISGAGVTISTGDLTVGAIGLDDPGTDAITSGASLAGYFNTTSGLTATNVQAALDEIVNGGILPAGADTNTLRSDGTDWIVATNLTNDGTDVGVTGELDVTGGFTDANATTAITLGDASNTTLDIGSSIVGGINAVHTNTLTNTTAINAVKDELDDTQTGAGLEADGTMAAWSGTNYLDGAADLKAGITALDTAVGNLSSGIQLTDSGETDAGAACTVGEEGLINYTKAGGATGEFIGCVQTEAGVYIWVRLSIYTE